MDQLLDEGAAALLLGMSRHTLKSHRLNGSGPVYSRLGRLVRYRDADLSAWVSANSKMPDRPQTPPAVKETTGSDES